MKINFVLVIAVICITLLVSCSQRSIEDVPGENESDWEITNLIKISRDELIEMIEGNQDFYVYFGRPSCPDCLVFYPKFKEILEESRQKIYYYSTEARVSEKAKMIDFIKPFGIKAVPSILHIKDKSVLKIYDGQKDEDLSEFKKLVS